MKKGKSVIVIILFMLLFIWFRFGFIILLGDIEYLEGLMLDFVYILVFLVFIYVFCV